MFFQKKAMICDDTIVDHGVSFYRFICSLDYGKRSYEILANYVKINPLSITNSICITE